VIARQREAIAECEAGRLVDGALQRAALASRELAAERNAAELATARATLAARLTEPACRAWAEQASCVEATP
jgi:hypothetical protein